MFARDMGQDADHGIFSILTVEVKPVIIGRHTQYRTVFEGKFNVVTAITLGSGQGLKGSDFNVIDFHGLLSFRVLFEETSFCPSIFGRSAFLNKSNEASDDQPVKQNQGSCSICRLCGLFDNFLGNLQLKLERAVSRPFSLIFARIGAGYAAHFV